MSSWCIDGSTQKPTSASKAATARTGSQRRTRPVSDKAPRAIGTPSEGATEQPGISGAFFGEFLETELIELADFPQLKQLCWNLKIEFLTRADAFAIYERNWRLIDQAALEPTERHFIDELIQKFGKGMLNA